MTDLQSVVRDAISRGSTNLSVMSSMKILPLLLAAGFLLAGCNKPTEGVKNATTVQVGGATYTKISEAHDGYLELWEKTGEPNFYYTPTLESTIHPERPPLFNSIPK